MSKSKTQSGDFPDFQASLDGLARWFERQKRVLPWRNEPTLYRVWVSEIMLQQTQVITVIPYFERFVERFPSVEALADAPQEDVLMHWAGLGYYSRARNLHKAAGMIVAAGGFPRDREGWLKIPGVGNYTAGAILSIALDQPEAILDGNVERVLSRVRAVTRAAGDEAFKKRLWRLSKIFVQRSHSRGIRPSVLNQALMELGATTCTPKKPKCLLCPLSAICRARADSRQEEFPPRKKPKKWLQVIEETHCVFDSQGRVLLTLSAPGEWRAGLWDFPKVVPSGNLVRVGQVESRLIVTRHKIRRTAHVWKVAKTTLQASENSAGNSNLRWVSPEDPGVPVGSSMRKTVRAIRESFPEILPER